MRSKACQEPTWDRQPLLVSTPPALEKPVYPIGISPETLLATSGLLTLLGINTDIGNYGQGKSCKLAET